MLIVFTQRTQVFHVNSPVIFSDDISANHLATNPMLHNRMKHLDINFHFVCDLVTNGDLDVRYVRSEDQHANVFTKSLAKIQVLTI